MKIFLSKYKFKIFLFFVLVLSINKTNSKVFEKFEGYYSGDNNIFNPKMNITQNVSKKIYSNLLENFILLSKFFFQSFYIKNKGTLSILI